MLRTPATNKRSHVTFWDLRPRLTGRLRPSPLLRHICCPSLAHEWRTLILPKTGKMVSAFRADNVQDSFRVL
jgi:hypothetical protein